MREGYMIFYDVRYGHVLHYKWFRYISPSHGGSQKKNLIMILWPSQKEYMYKLTIGPMISLHIFIDSIWWIMAPKILWKQSMLLMSSLSSKLIQCSDLNILYFSLAGFNHVCGEWDNDRNNLSPTKTIGAAGRATWMSSTHILHVM